MRKANNNALAPQVFPIWGGWSLLAPLGQLGFKESHT